MAKQLQEWGDNPSFSVFVSPSGISDIHAAASPKGLIRTQEPPEEIQFWQQPVAASRTQEAFKHRHQCKDEDVLRETFDYLKYVTAGDFRCADIRRRLGHVHGLGFLSVNQRKVSLELSKAPSVWGDPLPSTDVKRAVHFQKIVQDLLDEVDLPDMEFAVHFPDDNVPTLLDGTPILQNQGRVGKDLLHVPRSLWDILSGNMSTKTNDIANITCASRIPKAVFRGAPTGFDGPSNSSGAAFQEATLRNWRYRVASLSARRPDILDAGFHHIYGGWSSFQSSMKHVMKDPLTDQQLACYSAVVVVDGNTLADRLPHQLKYGIPVILLHHANMSFTQANYRAITTSIDEFWYPELTAGQDYMQASTENLEGLLDTMSKSWSSYKSIGSRGRTYVMNALGTDRLKCYMYQLLSEYGRYC
eukprot:CAMPEP_0197694020 /NCGR_PEP_ID=MMETSP1338-20131121/113281_1 /TAXON_ID=43686 ORGANISM="Pelagodinium beii, Strain RCC1491" /NCGR_SAMPLE_ID=MMETSP1338 /ASSEMBLY_ACC=CAM_ASM_000754 /LENGTH=415 /DNA_ID=CAMNT_0043276819 /DNA_START=125 /DNA_END=1369 /DNA_ORIENTATION=+